MCYSAVQLKRKTLKDAKFKGASPEEIERLEKLLQEAEKLESFKQYYHANAFDHPQLAVIEKDGRDFTIKQMHWGLIPPWTKNREDALEIWNRTPNARGESIFEKPSFKDAALNSRCILPLAGYFEHHHKGNKTFPYFIYPKEEQQLFIGALSSRWIAPQLDKTIETFSIVTTKPTEFLAGIHNNPKRNESRMPLILNIEDILTWLDGEEKEVRELIKPNLDIELVAHPTNKLSGARYLGNVPEILEPHHYSELDEQKNLFDE